MEQELENYKEVQTDYEDFRFGKINILHNPATNQLIMQKQKISETNNDHSATKKNLQDRMLIQHPNILEMKNLTFQDSEKTCNVYFKYPNEDLYERQQLLTNPQEILKLLYDCISGLGRLEKEKTVHGNLKPEFIYFEKESGNYVLLDRLADQCSPNQAQYYNFQNNNMLYMSPKVFENIMDDNLRIQHNPFKSEIFSLGMVILSLLVNDEQELQKVYNIENKIFDRNKFLNILSEVRQKFFAEGDAHLLGDFFYICVLNPDSSKRMNPRKAYICLKRTIETFTKELRISELQNMNMNIHMSTPSLAQSDLTTSQCQNFRDTLEGKEGQEFFDVNVNPSNTSNILNNEQTEQEEQVHEQQQQVYLNTDHLDEEGQRGRQTAAFGEGIFLDTCQTLESKGKPKTVYGEFLVNKGEEGKLEDGHNRSTFTIGQDLIWTMQGEKEKDHKNDAFIQQNTNQQEKSSKTELKDDNKDLKENLQNQFLQDKNEKNEILEQNTKNEFSLNSEESQSELSKEELETLKDADTNLKPNQEEMEGSIHTLTNQPTDLSYLDFDISMSNNQPNNLNTMDDQTINMSYSIPTMVNQMSQKDLQSQNQSNKQIQDSEEKPIRRKATPAIMTNLNILTLNQQINQIRSSKGIEFQFEDEEVCVQQQEEFRKTDFQAFKKKQNLDRMKSIEFEDSGKFSVTRRGSEKVQLKQVEKGKGVQKSRKQTGSGVEFEMEDRASLTPAPVNDLVVDVGSRPSVISSQKRSQSKLDEPKGQEESDSESENLGNDFNVELSERKISLSQVKGQELKQEVQTDKPGGQVLKEELDDNSLKKQYQSKEAEAENDKEFNSKQFLENNQVQITQQVQSQFKGSQNQKSKAKAKATPTPKQQKQEQKPNEEQGKGKQNDKVHNQNIQIINNTITNINIIPLQNSNLHSNLIDETKNIHENINDIKKEWQKQKDGQQQEQQPNPKQEETQENDNNNQKRSSTIVSTNTQKTASFVGTAQLKEIDEPLVEEEDFGAEEVDQQDKILMDLQGGEVNVSKGNQEEIVNENEIETQDFVEQSQKNTISVEAVKQEEGVISGKQIVELSESKDKSLGLGQDKTGSQQEQLSKEDLAQQTLKNIQKEEQHEREQQEKQRLTNQKIELQTLQDEEKERFQKQEEEFKQEEIKQEQIQLEKDQQRTLKEQEYLENIHQADLKSETERIAKLQNRERQLQAKEDKQLHELEQKLKEKIAKRKEDERNRMKDDLLKRKAVERKRDLNQEIKEKAKLLKLHKQDEKRRKELLAQEELDRLEIERLRKQILQQRALREQKLQQESKELLRLQKLEKERLDHQQLYQQLQEKEIDLKKILQKQQKLQNKYQYEISDADEEMQLKIKQQQKQNEQLIQRIQDEQAKQKQLRVLYDQKTEYRRSMNEDETAEILSTLNKKIEEEQRKANELEILREKLLKQVQLQAQQLENDRLEYQKQQELEAEQRKENEQAQQQIDEIDQTLLISLNRQQNEITKIMQQNDELLRKQGEVIPEFATSNRQKSFQLLADSAQIIAEAEENILQSHSIKLKNLLSQSQLEKDYKIRDVFHYRQGNNAKPKEISICKIFNFNHFFKNKQQIYDEKFEYRNQMCHNFYLLQFSLKRQHIQILKKNTMKSLQVTNLHTTYNEHKQIQHIRKHQVAQQQTPDQDVEQQFAQVQQNNQKEPQQQQHTQQQFMPQNKVKVKVRASQTQMTQQQKPLQIQQNRVQVQQVLQQQLIPQHQISVQQVIQHKQFVPLYQQGRQCQGQPQLQRHQGVQQQRSINQSSNVVTVSLQDEQQGNFTSFHEIPQQIPSFPNPQQNSQRNQIFKQDQHKSTGIPYKKLYTQNQTYKSQRVPQQQQQSRQRQNTQNTQNLSQTQYSQNTIQTQGRMVHTLYQTQSGLTHNFQKTQKLSHTSTNTFHQQKLYKVNLYQNPAQHQGTSRTSFIRSKQTYSRSPIQYQRGNIMVKQLQRNVTPNKINLQITSQIHDSPLNRNLSQVRGQKVHVSQVHEVNQRQVQRSKSPLVQKSVQKEHFVHSRQILRSKSPIQQNIQNTHQMQNRQRNVLRSRSPVQPFQVQTTHQVHSRSLLRSKSPIQYKNVHQLRNQQRQVLRSKSPLNLQLVQPAMNKNTGVRSYYQRKQKSPIQQVRKSSFTIVHPQKNQHAANDFQAPQVTNSQRWKNSYLSQQKPKQIQNQNQKLYTQKRKSVNKNLNNWVNSQQQQQESIQRQMSHQIVNSQNKNIGTNFQQQQDIVKFQKKQATGTGKGLQGVKVTTTQHLNTSFNIKTQKKLEKSITVDENLSVQESWMKSLQRELEIFDRTVEKCKCCRKRRLSQIGLSKLVGNEKALHSQTSNSRSQQVRNGNGTGAGNEGSLHFQLYNEKKLERESQRSIKSISLKPSLVSMNQQVGRKAQEISFKKKLVTGSIKGNQGGQRPVQQNKRRQDIQSFKNSN